MVRRPGPNIGRPHSSRVCALHKLVEPEGLVSGEPSVGSIEGAQIYAVAA